MSDERFGCGGCVLSGIALIIVLNLGSCIVGTIWDGVQEVLAERHAKQEVADARAREKFLEKEKQRRFAEEKAREAERAEAMAAERYRREEELRREVLLKKEAAERRERIKIDKLRMFAMKEAPGIWHAYQRIGAEIKVQDERIKDLAASLKVFEKDPETDADYRSICSARMEMDASQKDIRRKLENAYLAFCRFKATSDSKETRKLLHKALEDGVQAADTAARRFEQLKIDK